MSSSWQDAAAKKREAISALIPAEWRLDSTPSVEEQVDVTEFIKQYLSEEELAITESDAEQIVEKTTSRAWSAEKVACAFCHRAALAHQLVIRSDGMFHHAKASTNNGSYTVSTRSSLMQLSPTRKS
jgi:amidase